jgi:hypothetical protein
MELTLVYCDVYEVSPQAEGGKSAILPDTKDK